MYVYYLNSETKNKQYKNINKIRSIKWILAI